ncbi:MAG: oligosaccharide flippase family protein [Candidatus Fervidibacter sp.]|uniref:oligosaccharide flippase family protein n=1 Tax=Candidatus Fervidibacter sp. TaxID=3100871 RepID=UPI0040490440
MAATEQVRQSSGLARRVARNMVSRSARHFVSALVGFVLIPMFTKYLGADQYGVWVLAQSVVGYLNLMEFGLTTTLTRHLAAAKATGDYDQANRILGQLATLMWFVGALITLGAIGGSLLLPHLFKLDPMQAALFQWAFSLIGIQAALGVVTNIWEGAMSAVEDYHILNGLYIFAALARFAYSIALLKLGYGLLALLSAQFVVIGIVWLLDHLYMKWRYPQLSFRPRWYGWREAKPLAKFSTAVFVSHISGLLANDTDKVIAGAMLGPTAVAIYQVGYKLYDLARTIFASSIGVLMPTAAGLAARNEQERLRRMLCQVSSVMVGILGAIYIPFIFYGKSFILLWVGPKFSESAAVLGWLSAAILVSAHNQVLGPVLWGTGDYQVLLRSSLLYAIANAALSIVLCLQWGVVGIAAATAITAVPVQLFFLGYAMHKFQVSLWDYFGRAWVGALTGTLVGWGLGQLLVVSHAVFEGWWLLLAQGAVFELGFWTFMWLIGFTPQTRFYMGQVFCKSPSNSRICGSLSDSFGHEVKPRV